MRMWSCLLVAGVVSSLAVNAQPGYSPRPVQEKTAAESIAIAGTKVRQEDKWGKDSAVDSYAIGTAQTQSWGDQPNYRYKQVRYPKETFVQTKSVRQGGWDNEYPEWRYPQNKKEGGFSSFAVNEQGGYSHGPVQEKTVKSTAIAGTKVRQEDKWGKDSAVDSYAIGIAQTQSWGDQPNYRYKQVRYPKETFVQTKSVRQGGWDNEYPVCSCPQNKPVRRVGYETKYFNDFDGNYYLDEPVEYNRRHTRENEHTVSDSVDFRQRNYGKHADKTVQDGSWTKSEYNYKN